MVYPGGELAFVSQMACESRTLGNRIHWYTTMVGKKATLKQLRKQLHAGRVTALRTTEFVQVRLGCRQWQTCCRVRWQCCAHSCMPAGFEQVCATWQRQLVLACGVRGREQPASYYCRCLGTPLSIEGKVLGIKGSAVRICLTGL